jgi:predicted tellurium resistance membrane protein TerC
MSELLTTDNLIALLTLSALEIVLGIDNIIFISILSGKLPVEQRAKARQIGLVLAMLMRIGLLFALSWVMGLVEPLFRIMEHEISGRDLILLGGGLFLIGKSTFEIHERLEGPQHGPIDAQTRIGFSSVLIQIMLLDIVFSLDSVITAVGMVQNLTIMIAAVIVAVAVMMIFAGAVSDFVERHPAIKMLALSFLILIGVMLVAEGLGQHVSKGYIYFAMAFSLLVELLNMRLRKVSAAKVQLHGPRRPQDQGRP